MSNRIENVFQNNRKALITFVTAGDPDLDTTYELVLAMEKAGADLVELGVPYSDPVAEGPVIQAANARALKNDVRLDKLFELVSKLRKRTNIPLVFLLYVNSILQYGKERFFDSCKANGLDGVIIPDLPYEESDEIYTSAKEKDIKLIRLVTPTSKERIEMIAKRAEGFLYCVSSLGVTGVRSDFKTDFERFFETINQFKSAPTAIGFGISTPKQIKELKHYCDGVIVGSAIVKKIAEAKNSQDAIKNVSDFVKSLKNALNS